jgi:hypothetical protein
MNSTSSCAKVSIGSLLVGLLVVGSLAAGCDGRTPVGVARPDGSGSQAAGGADAALPDLGGAGGAGGIAGGADGPVGKCPQAGVDDTPTTIDDMRAVLSRNWALCSPLGLTSQPADGLVITADDRYAALERDASGALVAQHGVDFEGTVTYLQIGSAVQTSFTSDLGGTVVTRPVLTTNPVMLIINNEGVYEYRYLALIPFA